MQQIERAQLQHIAGGTGACKTSTSTLNVSVSKSSSGLNIVVTSSKG
jgi:hypothetical protein